MVFFEQSGSIIFQYILNLKVHIAVVRPGPEHPSAFRAESEGVGAFINEWSHQILCLLFGQGFKGHIAFNTPGVGPDLLFDIQFIQNLLDLGFPALALDKKHFDFFCFFNDASIPCQEDAVLFPGDSNEPVILSLGEKKRIKSKDPQPFGALSQHTVNHKFHDPLLLL